MDRLDGAKDEFELGRGLFSHCDSANILSKDFISRNRNQNEKSANEQNILRNERDRRKDGGFVKGELEKNGKVFDKTIRG